MSRLAELMNRGRFETMKTILVPAFATALLCSGCGSNGDNSVEKPGKKVGNGEAKASDLSSEK